MMLKIKVKLVNSTGLDKQKCLFYLWFRGLSFIMTVLNHYYKSMKISLLVTLITILYFQTYLASNEKKCDIHINHKQSKIEINGHQLMSNKLKHIKSIIGKPDRIEIIDKVVRVEEWPYKRGGQRHSYTKKVKDYYHIYDKLGIMFRTNNGKSAYNKRPSYLIIVYDHKREFDNTEPLKFSPKKKYKSILKINGIILDPSKPVITNKINYRTNKFSLFGTTFSATTFTMMIDSIYAYDRKPGIRIYFNNPKDKNVSYVTIFIG